MIFIATDRFSNYESALLLNHGYCLAPPDVYFNGNLTITVWVKLNSKHFHNKILAFSDEINSNNVELSTYFDGRSHIGFWIRNKDIFSSIGSNTELVIDKWNHVSVSLMKTEAKIYLNGQLDKTGYISSPKPTVRTLNYIGKSNWNNENADAIYDELKIFNRALLPEEIAYEASLKKTLLITKSNSSTSNKSIISIFFCLTLVLI